MAVSLVLGMGLGSMAGSPRRSVRWLVTLYVWLFRGAPALLVLLFVWNGLPQISEVFRAGWFTPFVAAFLALSLIQIAYLAEVLRSAFSAVGRGQQEGAAALGMHRWQIFLVITMPQALRIAVPSLMNEFISLLKTTSLADCDLAQGIDDSLAIRDRHELPVPRMVWRSPGLLPHHRLGAGHLPKTASNMCFRAAIADRRKPMGWI